MLDKVTTKMSERTLRLMKEEGRDTPLGMGTIHYDAYQVAQMCGNSRKAKEHLRASWECAKLSEGPDSALATCKYANMLLVSVSQRAMTWQQDGGVTRPYMTWSEREAWGKLTGRGKRKPHQTVRVPPHTEATHICIRLGRGLCEFPASSRSELHPIACRCG
jgi:hypothetical protein